MKWTNRSVVDGGQPDETRSGMLLRPCLDRRSVRQVTYSVHYMDTIHEYKELDPCQVGSS